MELPQRSSISFGLPESGGAAHPGDPIFNQTLLEHYHAAEAVALDQAIALKEKARTASLEDFWQIFAEGLASIVGSQIALVSQRLYFDEATSTSLPAIGEPDSCLSALAWYYNDEHGKKEVGSNVRYYAWGCPCAAMKYGKVFLIPSKVNEYSPENPNTWFTALGIDAYLGLPLFFDGECHAHFGLAWNDEGSTKRKLGWALIESICHSFEDLISQRIIEGAAVKSAAAELDISQLPGDYETAPAFRTWKPPVHILSHELRTPMQGVVGMLDIMHDIVQEAVEIQQNSKARDIFKGLKADIETIQDSSKRAVDAADNVVQAYELESQMSSKASTGRASSPVNTPDSGEPVSPARRPSTASVGTKRKSSIVSGSSSPRPAKVRLLKPPYSPAPTSSPLPRESDQQESIRGSSEIRALFGPIVSDSLKVHGRPTSTTFQDTNMGQRCEAVFADPNEGETKKSIEWSVQPAVPERIPVPERDFVKLVSCILQNSVKFTRDAMITIQAEVDPPKLSLVITFRDNGPGIDSSFQARVFEPFSREDTSITRQREGLGLGLAVAKGIAEKLGGSLDLARTDTSGPHRGSVFELTLPIEEKQFLMPKTPMTEASAGSREVSTSHPKQPKRTTVEKIATTHPLTFLVAEDNQINRKLLVNMLIKLGYNPATQIYEAHDGLDAVNRAKELLQSRQAEGRLKGAPAKSPIDIVLMDLWMPRMDGYEAAERILSLFKPENTALQPPTIMAVTADVTANAEQQATKAGMKGLLTKPFQLKGLESFIKQGWEERMKVS